MLRKTKELLAKGINNNSFFTLFLRLSGVLFIFLTTFLFTNNYESEVVGQYDFIRSYFLVIGSLIMLSSDQTILFLIGRYNNSSQTIIDVYKKILFITFILYVLNNLCFRIFFYFDIFSVNKITESLIMKSNLVLFFYCVYLINIEILRALEYTFVSETFRNIIKYLPLMVGFLCLNTLGMSNQIIDFFIYGFIFIAVFSSIILFFLFKKHNKTFDSNYTKDTFKFIIKYSLPVTLSTVSLYLLSSIDIFFLKYFFGDNYVAYYSVAFKIISFISVAINAIGLSVATALAYNYKKGDFDALKKIVNSSAKLIFYFSMTFSVFVLIFSELILSVFGKEYLISQETLIFLIIGNLVASISGNTYMYLLMTNKGKVLGKLIFSAAIINVVLNFVLIPSFSLKGAAISSIISILFWNYLGAYFIYKQDKINILFKFK
jgi:O-antigen/teichoic acid export membrane protein